jgi:FdhD protein
VSETNRDTRLLRFRGEVAVETRDPVAWEEPLEIRIGGVPVAVVMRTPGADRELVLGFLVGEGLVEGRSDVASVRHCRVSPDPDGDGNVVQVVFPEGAEPDLERLRRNLYATSSCGVCGKASIEVALRTAPPLEDDVRLPPGFFYPLPDRLGAAQQGFAASGGLHAAGLFDAGGRLLVAREDVGRHNAVDKVVGWALDHDRLPLHGHVLMVSGRVSFEVVQKALAARIPIVAAVSAPTSLAVSLAESAGITLVAFLRGQGLNAHGRTERLLR